MLFLHQFRFRRKTLVHRVNEKQRFSCSKYIYIYKNADKSNAVYSPLQLLDGHGDLEVMSQHMQRSEDVGPLDHLSQRTALQHFGAEHISRLLGEEADVDQDLKQGHDAAERLDTSQRGEAQQQKLHVRRTSTVINTVGDDDIFRFSLEVKTSDCPCSTSVKARVVGK